LLVMAVACTDRPVYENSEVAGKVLIRGQPLQGGRVTFVAVNGGLATTATIDENGNYKIMAPVGEVKISVDNRQLKPQGKHKHPSPVLHKQEGEQPTTMKGHYRVIASKYYNAEESGLSYTVEKGAQTHDIKLQ
jgi:hypothetical protein